MIWKILSTPQRKDDALKLYLLGINISTFYTSRTTYEKSKKLKSVAVLENYTSRTTYEKNKNIN